MRRHSSNYVIQKSMGVPYVELPGPTLSRDAPVRVQKSRRRGGKWVPRREDGVWAEEAWDTIEEAMEAAKGIQHIGDDGRIYWSHKPIDPETRSLLDRRKSTRRVDTCRECGRVRHRRD